jgi:predicted DsbA family dithiol-disulfide isomerase
LKRDYDVAVTWQPFDLHPEIPPDGTVFPPEVKARFAPMEARLQQMAAAQGMPLVFRERVPSSRRALEASEFARAQGKHDAFHRRVFHLFYGEGKDMSAWAVLREAALAAGLDPDEMQIQTEAGAYAPALEQRFAAARALGISGVPAYVFADRYLISGAQPYSVFKRLMARLEDESRGQ